MDAILPGLLLLSHAASAGHLEAARTAERAGDHTGEHRACTALLADSPGGSGSEACRRRLVWLDARRDADGGFAWLEELQTVRRDRRSLDPSTAWQRVTAVARAPGAAARVRDEAATWLAREALDRTGDADLALSWTTPLWERLEPEASQPGSLRAQVADLHARALLAAGDAAAASAVDAAAQPVRSAIPREGLPLALRARQKERVRSGAWAGLALFGLAAGPPAARTWAASPRPTPRGLLPLVVVGIGAGGLVALWDASLAPSFLVLVSILAGVHIIAAGALAATPAGPWRHGQRAMAIIGTLAAAWLAADASGLAARVGL